MLDIDRGESTVLDSDALAFNHQGIEVTCTTSHRLAAAFACPNSSQNVIDGCDQGRVFIAEILVAVSTSESEEGLPIGSIVFTINWQ